MRSDATGLFAGCLAVLLLGGSCTGLKLGRLRPGMSQSEVRALFGDPTGMAPREQVGPDDLREVWVYHVPRLLDQDTPLYPAIHFVVFKNGKALGWDLPHPYRPDLK